MTDTLLATYEPILRAMDERALQWEIELPRELLIETGVSRGKRLDIVYAPFDHVTAGARIVIVGITPGRQQMRNALFEFHRALRAGLGSADALARAKVHASFSGPMRHNLIALLDDIGVNRVLGIDTSASLWTASSDLVQFTSVLRYPVFVDGENYSGAPSMLTTPILRAQLERWIVAEMRALPDALFVPLGPKVSEALEVAAKHAGLASDQILSGLPHPSGASAERIAYFLGRKPRELLSRVTNAEKLDAARASLLDKVARLVG